MREDITCVFEGVAGVGGIFISNIMAAQNIHILNKYGIKAIVTALQGGLVKHTKDEVPDHLYIPVYDMPTQDLAKYFNETYQFIDSVRKKTNVLVHCHAGISRSATIVIAYLLRKFNYSLEHVVTIVKRRRSKINPNKGFLEQLKKEAMKMGLSTINNNTVENILQAKPKNRSIEKQRAISAYSEQRKINKSIDNQNYNHKNLLKLQKQMTKSCFKNQQKEDGKIEKHQSQKKKNYPNLFSFQYIQNKKNDVKPQNYYNFPQKREIFSTEIKSAKVSTEALNTSKYLNPKLSKKIERFREKVKNLEKSKNMYENEFKNKCLKTQTDDNDECFEGILSKKSDLKQIEKNIYQQIGTKNNEIHHNSYHRKVPRFFK